MSAHKHSLASSLLLLIFLCWMMKCMGPEHDDNVFSPTDLNLLNWSSLEFQIFLLHQKTSHCRLLTWIQEELHMQWTKHTSMVVYMFLHFINLKFLQYKINTKESWKKMQQSHNPSNNNSWNTPKFYSQAGTGVRYSLIYTCIY